MKRLGPWMLCMLLALLALTTRPGPAEAVGETYTVTGLGALGGADARSAANDINGRGQIVGTSDTGAGEEHAVLWDDGRISDLGTLGGAYSAASAINAPGQVVGWAMTGDGHAHAVLWDDGHVTDLGTLGGNVSVALDINDQGQVVGYAQTAGGPYHAFLWESGAMTDLGPFSATAIGPAGRVVGFGPVAECTSGEGGGATHAVSWEDGTLTDLGLLGGRASTATAVNAAGAVVGWSQTGEPCAITAELHAVRWDEGVPSDLGTLGGLQSQALAIDDEGTAVGWSNYTAGDTRHGARWDGETAQDLNSLLVPGTAWTIEVATAINAAGQIVGAGMSSTGTRQAVLLTPSTATTPGPSPDPSSPPDPPPSPTPLPSPSPPASSSPAASPSPGPSPCRWSSRR